jgi:hypothetical protein
LSKYKPPLRKTKARLASGQALPVYDSIQACSSATGIPVAALRLAKKNGCNAFAHSRVDLGLFIRFTFSMAGKDISNWADHKLEASAKREWIKLQKDEGNVIDRGHARDAAAQLAGAIDSTLEKVFVSEFPPACVGLDPMAISQLAKQSKARVWDELKVRAAAIGESNEPA